MENILKAREILAKIKKEEEMDSKNTPLTLEKFSKFIEFLDSPEYLAAEKEAYDSDVAQVYADYQRLVKKVKQLESKKGE